MFKKDNYEKLLYNLPFGYAYHKIVLDHNNEPIDYTTLDVNPAYEVITGNYKKGTVNKKNPELIEIYGKVAMKGLKACFEQYFDFSKKYYEVTVYSDRAGHFVEIFKDITEEKRIKKMFEESLKSWEILLAESKNEDANLINKYRALELQNQKLTYEINERIKEQICLYKIASLDKNPNITTSEILQKAVDLIPSGGQFPEKISARIVFREKEYTTKDFFLTPWKATCY